MEEGESSLRDESPTTVLLLQQIPKVPVALTKELIDRSIDCQCVRLSNNGFQRCQQDDLGGLLYGIVVPDKDDDNKPPLSVVTFYVSYSTWDGRFLYVDDAMGNWDLIQSGLKLLARIAVDLGCRRLTWQYLEGRPIVDSVTPHPEVLHGWWTLHWSASEITKFLSSTDLSCISKHGDIRSAFEATLATVDNSSFRLRLATEIDLDAITRLVHGLAVYEKMPDAVHVTKDHYRCDGLSTQPPLFYCVLLDKIDGVHNDDSSYTCGMAFCYVARRKSGGLFLYLEDLFIEQDYRGAGGGMIVMKTLARVSLSLGCTKMVWQALDWNTPALNFYNKLGARVVEGLITARFTGEALTTFALLT